MISVVYDKIHRSPVMCQIIQTVPVEFSFGHKALFPVSHIATFSLPSFLLPSLYEATCQVGGRSRSMKAADRRKFSLPYLFHSNYLIDCFYLRISDSNEISLLIHRLM